MSGRLVQTRLSVLVTTPPHTHPRSLQAAPALLPLQHDAQMDYYGTRLATCSSDRSVKIFDVRNGGQILIADLRG